ncbi:MAG: AAA family ATPase [Pseudomonadota bacterium]
MYHQYFGLAEAPFSIAVNPRYLYMSPRHRDALAHLLYGIEAGGGFILLTGEVGTGKTTINRCLLQQLPESADVALILNPALDSQDLLASVCEDLGLDLAGADRRSLKTLTDALHEFLLRNHRNGRKTVLMIDEAQHLNFDVLEQIRLLTNLETEDKKLLHIILIGQPELGDKLRRPELRQLNQRITARYELLPLDAKETGAYIKHRLHVAGLAPGQRLFSDSLVRTIHRRSQGVPRLINLICDRSLLGAYGQGVEQPNQRLVTRAVAEVTGQGELRPVGPGWYLMDARALAVVGVLFGALLLAWFWASSESGTGRSTPPSSARIAEVDRAQVEQATPAGDATSNDEPGFARTRDPAQSDSQSPGQTPVRSPMPTRDKSQEQSGPQISARIEPDDFDQQNAWRMTGAEAAQRLLSLYGEDGIAVSTDICAAALPRELTCLRATRRSWNELMADDRPAVLILLGIDLLEYGAVFLGLAGQDLLLAGPGSLLRVPAEQVAAVWTGEVRMLRRAPSEIRRTLKRGDQGRDVALVARYFADLDGEEAPLAGDSFGSALETRVAMFQQANGLDADGVFGEKTLQKLIMAIGADVNLERARQQVASVSAMRES